MPKPDIRHKALELLARREHTRDELQTKLIRKGFSQDSITRLLDVLVGKNLLSSTRYIEDYIESRVHRAYGPNRIRMELESKGLDKAEVAQGLRDAGVDWLGTAQHCYTKKYHSTVAKDIKERMKRKQYLYRQGYPQEIIQQVIESLSP